MSGRRPAKRSAPGAGAKGKPMRPKKAASPSPQKKSVSKSKPHQAPSPANKKRKQRDDEKESKKPQPKDEEEDEEELAVSDGEAVEDEDLESGDEDAAQAKPSESKGVAKRSFGEALSSLLAAEPAEEAKEKAPVLAANKKVAAEQRQKELERQAKKDQLEKRKLKKAVLAKDHVIPQFDEVERRLVKVATRGVVTLFNAVQQQQKHAKEKEEAVQQTKKKKTSNVEHVSKDTFLEMLRGSGASDDKKEDDAVTVDEGAKTGSSGSKWSALRDDYMLKAKMTDWDKESESEHDDE